MPRNSGHVLEADKPLSVCNAMFTWVQGSKFNKEPGGEFNIHRTPSGGRTLCHLNTNMFSDKEMHFD